MAVYLPKRQTVPMIKLFDETTGEPHADLFGNGEVIRSHVYRMLEHFEATYGLDELTCLASASYISDMVRAACWDKVNELRNK